VIQKSEEFYYEILLNLEEGRPNAGKCLRKVVEPNKIALLVLGPLVLSGLDGIGVKAGVEVKTDCLVCLWLVLLQTFARREEISFSKLLQ